jgi:internalin A
MTEDVLYRIQKEMREKTGRLILAAHKLLTIPEQIEEMPWLRELDLSYNQITDIIGLKSLANLRILDLSQNRISTISGLDKLINLEELYLNNNQITDINGMLALKKLQKLNLSNNHIFHISGLEMLTNLQKLDFRNNKITEITGLDALQNLYELDISHNQVREIKGFGNLANLKILELQINPLENISELKSLLWMPCLEQLYLFGIKENNLNIPVEKFGVLYNEDVLDYGEFGNVLYPSNYKPRPKNCLQQLKSYFMALETGASLSREVPVILIGNTTAGKTSLRHFIKDRIFPPPEETHCSTHGIEPDIWKLTAELLNETGMNCSLEGAQIYFWDFGGQEYYHATHRLFLPKEAIYVLLWDHNTNIQAHAKTQIRMKRINGIIEEVEQVVELFSYEHWIKTIRFFAPDASKAPIILVQNKLDEAGNQYAYPDPRLREEYGHFDVHHISVKNASSGKPNGIAYQDFMSFARRLILLVETNLTNTARETHWEGVKHLLAQYKEHEQIWSPKNLHAQIQEVYPDIILSGFASYLDSLSSKGLIFYYSEDPFLKNYVFISPGWITEVIYDILDESVLKNNGEFDRKHVEQKLRARGLANTNVFIALMKKFELIFENPETEQFVAPQYLPENLSDKKMARGTWNRLKYIFDDFTNPHFHIRSQGFLPASIMLRFLSFYGPTAIEQNYWKNGIAFMLHGKEVVILADYKEFLFHVYVQHGDRYTESIVFNTLHYLIGRRETTEVSIDGKHYVQYHELRKYSRNKEVATVKGELIASAPLRHFIAPEELLKKADGNADDDNEKVKIFISYAHEDEKTKDLLINTYLRAIKNHYNDDILVWSDGEIKPGCDWDSTICKKIENADIVLFLITNHFLASDYIKNTEIKKSITKFRQREQIIAPVYIEEVSKKILPFKEKQYLPGGNALEYWQPKSRGWTKIQDGIITLIDDVKNGNTKDYFD